MHDRLEEVGTLLFLGAVGVLALVSLGRLWVRPALRPTVLALLATFGLLAVSTLQEHARGFGTFIDEIPLMSMAVEETIELVAYLAMWVVTVLAPTADRVRDPLVDPRGLPGAAVVLVVLGGLHSVLSVLVFPSLRIEDFGDPGAWFPSAAFLLLALDVRAPRVPGAGPRWWHAGWPLGASALMLVALSAAGPQRFEEYGLGVPARVVVGVVLVATLLLAWPRVVRRSLVAGLVAGTVVVGIGADILRDLAAVRYVAAAVVPVGPLLLALGRDGPHPTARTPR